MSGLPRTRGAWRAVAAALILAPLALPTARASAADPPVRIMVVGDSMTEGSSGDWTWRYRLAKYLDAAGVDYDFVGPRTTMLDLATSEHTSLEYADPDFDRDHFSRWGESLHAILAENAAVPDDAIGPAVAEYQPDVVIELLGVNDLLFGSSPQETLDVAHTFVDEVRAAKPDTTVVMSTVPAEQYAHVADYNDLLSATASTWSLPSSPVVVSDPAPGWSPAVDTCDNTHPSAVGDVRIAAAEGDALSTLGIGTPTPRPLPTPPVGPRLPAVLDVARGDGRAVVSWHLPPGGTAVLISVRDVSAGEPWRQLPFPVEGTSWVSAGLHNGDTYRYRLHVLKHECLANDVVSNTVAVTPEPRSPGRVTGVHVTSVDHGLRARWSATARATSCAVWVKRSDRRTGWTKYRSDGRARTVHGLRARVSYDVAVRARNAGGLGPLSRSVTVVPGPARPRK